MFQKKKSLTELEEEGEQLDTEISVMRKRLMLRELGKRGGVGFWRRFSTDGTQRGINFRAVFNWLKTH